MSESSSSLDESNLPNISKFFKLIFGFGVDQLKSLNGDWLIISKNSSRYSGFIPRNVEVSLNGSNISVFSFISVIGTSIINEVAV